MSLDSAIFGTKTEEPKLNLGAPYPAVMFWAVVELMGHRVRRGLVQEVEMFGAKLLRIDVHTAAGPATEFYGGSSIYCVRPGTEAEVKAAAESQYGFHPVRQLTQSKVEDYHDDFDDDQPF